MKKEVLKFGTAPSPYYDWRAHYASWAELRKDVPELTWHAADGFHISGGCCAFTRLLPSGEVTLYVYKKEYAFYHLQHLSYNFWQTYPAFCRPWYSNA